MLENYFHNVTRNCLSKMHIMLKLTIKSEGTAGNIALYFCKFMLFLKHGAVFKVLHLNHLIVWKNDKHAHL